MKIFIFFIALLSGMLSAQAAILSTGESTFPIATPNSSFAPRIIGGETAADGLWPWTVQVIIKYGYRTIQCGGTLINSEWVLTAAHCITEYAIAKADQVYVIANTNLRIPTDSDHEYAVSELIIHPEFLAHMSAGWIVYDAALLKLTHPIESKSYATLLTADQRDWAQPGMLATALGWGVTSANNFEQPEKLQQVEVPIATEEACRSKNPELDDYEICAGGIAGKDSCSGDSGGPLAIYYQDEWRVIGITSYGTRGCAQEGEYGVYTRVSSIHNWVMQQIGAESAQAVPVTGNLFVLTQLFLLGGLATYQRRKRKIIEKR